MFRKSILTTLFAVVLLSSANFGQTPFPNSGLLAQGNYSSAGPLDVPKGVTELRVTVYCKNETRGEVRVSTPIAKDAGGNDIYGMLVRIPCENSGGSMSIKSPPQKIRFEGFNLANDAYWAISDPAAPVKPPDIKEIPVNSAQIGAMKIRVKLAKSLISGRVRIGDDIPLTIAEDVLVAYTDNSAPPIQRFAVAFKKDTPVIGRVVDRKKRVAFFRAGKFAIAIDSIRAADGHDFNATIQRPQNYDDTGANTSPDYCPDRMTQSRLNGNNPSPSKQIPCVKGRTYSSSFTNALPSAILSSITAGVLVFVKDNTAKAAAGVTLGNELSKNTGLGSVINGVDGEMEDREIFIVKVQPGVNDSIMAKPY